jgi:prevent-host-death family protein
MERVISTVEARVNLSQILAEAGYAGRSTVIERNRRPLAVVIGYDEYRELTALRQQKREREARFAVYDEVRSRNADATPDQVETDVAEVLRAVRTGVA